MHPADPRIGSRFASTRIPFRAAVVDSASQARRWPLALRFRPLLPLLGGPGVAPKIRHAEELRQMRPLTRYPIASSPPGKDSEPSADSPPKIRGPAQS